MDRKGSSYKSRPPSSKTIPATSCVICYKSQTIFSTGPCDHPVCYECSTTMRVICDQKECPICRRIMTKVIFTREIGLFKTLDSRQYSRYNKKYGIAFDDHSIELHFDQLLRCFCKKCYDRPVFATFEQLAAHMQRNHHLYACQLCVKHLKIFPSQRRWYNYDELSRHEECGDTNNTSHRGHPQCQFCNVRYLDKDELYKHLRKEHFYCHFCDADGIQDYYMTYDWLSRHYRDKHYLCEEGNCINEQYTSVFRTSIDLQAHKAKAHGRELGKHGSKEARTLRLDFNLRPRNISNAEVGRPCVSQSPQSEALDFAPERAINVRDTSDFPSLNGQNTTVLPCARTRKQYHNVNTRDLHSFPALSQESGLPLKPQNPTTNIRMATMLKKPVEPPKPDRNKDAAAGPPVPRMPDQARDFPSLGGNQQQLKTKEVVALSANNSSGSSWVSKAKNVNENGQDEKKKAKKEPVATKKKVAEAPKLPGASDFPNLNKKLEPNKSNLAKLGNKKKLDNPKKTAVPVVQEVQNNNQNAKKNGGMQTTTVAENNTSSKKSTTLDGSNKSTDPNNKENSRPKAKSAEMQQCNGRSDVTSIKAATAGKTNPNNKMKVVSGESPGKETSFKKKDGPKLPDRPEEPAAENNNQKDKKKRKKNDNNKESPFGAVAVNSRQSSENLSITPKIPPGFENTLNQHMVRAPPGLTGSGNHTPPGLTGSGNHTPPGLTGSGNHTPPGLTGSGNHTPPGLTGSGNHTPPQQQKQQQIKAPPGLSLTTDYNQHNNNVQAAPINKLYEYVHPLGSSIRNKVLINNLMAALIPVQDERYNTFEKFKEISTLFRKHAITAYDFYSYCVEALCPHNFDDVFLELLLLLPDIQKQQELLYIYNRNSGETLSVEVCKYCRQVMRVNDVELHMSTHDNGRS